MKPSIAKLIRFTRILITLVVMAGLCWSAYEVVSYLRSAKRFEVQKLSVAGLKHVRESEVLGKAQFELGTNAFRVDLNEIRSRVEELDWVRHASVQRVLPDQIIINIVEREAIGLTRIKGEIYQFDVDGKILNVDAESTTSFPILDSLRPGDHAGNLRKVEVYRSVLDDVGQTALSEIHVNDNRDVTVVSASDPVMVNLGTGDFRTRWTRYLQLKPQIQQQYPEAVRVDLRFKNQVIIRMKDDDVGEKIVWGGKKNTL